VRYLYSYTGISKGQFEEILGSQVHISSTDEHFERKADFAKQVQAGDYEFCFNEGDIDISVSMEELKEAVTGRKVFVFNSHSPLFKQNKMVEAEHIKGMF